jgi:hypothetical protein
MKKFFCGFLIGALVAAAAGWYFFVAKDNPRLSHAWDAVDAQLAEWHLNGDEIREELGRTGKVLRRQVSDFGVAMASASSDTAITAKIKAKYALERDLSIFGISVNTTDGRVTLAGNVTSHRQIGRAMLIALKTDGVREVNSTLQVKPPKPSSS